MNFDKKKIRKLLTGLAYGDSIGVTTEFCNTFFIPDLYEKFKHKGWPFKAVGKSQWNLSPGDHTDDTDMAWAIVKSCHENNKFDPEDIANEFVKWLDTNPTDIGNTTYRILSKIRSGKYWYTVGKEDWERNKNNAANGSLMRNGIICGLTNDLNEAFEMTLLHGMITHYAPLPQLCCCIQTWLIYHFLNGVNKLKNSSWKKEFLQVFDNYREKHCENEYVLDWFKNVDPKDIHYSQTTDLEWASNLLIPLLDNTKFNPFEYEIGKSSGYCLLTLQIALWALQCGLEKDKIFIPPKNMPEEVFDKNGFDCLCWIPMIGYDADTYAATAGPLFTACFGDLSIERLSNLQINKWIDDLYNV